MEKSGKVTSEISFSLRNSALSMSDWGLPVFCSQCFLSTTEFQKLLHPHFFGYFASEKANVLTHMSSTFDFSPSSLPTTVPPLVFMHQPLKPSSFPRACVYCKKKHWEIYSLTFFKFEAKKSPENRASGDSAASAKNTNQSGGRYSVARLSVIKTSA